MAKTAVEHSPKFEELNSKYQKNYITIETLRGWVVINDKKPGRGITAEEFEEITGIEY